MISIISIEENELEVLGFEDDLVKARRKCIKYTNDYCVENNINKYEIVETIGGISCLVNNRIKFTLLTIPSIEDEDFE